MILNSLTLNNFRQFTGEQTINFSNDTTKKVTIVMAESGVGKTTLIQSISWIFYGDCKYKSPLNEEIKKSMKPGEKTIVSCSLNLSHNDRFYTITRRQSFAKSQTVVKIDGNSELIIDIRGKEGITEQKRGREADRIIKDLMHKDLFPYFFLEGENLTKVGEQVSKGKSGSNSEFVKAIKGLLGFNYLYEAKNHLGKVSSDYQTEIANNTTDKRMKDLIEQIQKDDDIITKANERLENIETEVEYNTKQRDDLSDEIQKYGELEVKQKRTKQLAAELLQLETKINEQKCFIFKKFSSQGFYTLLRAMLPTAEETLENADAVDKGIPGIEVSAVEFMLERHQCICGTKLNEGSPQWEELNNWIKFLPPNNIGLGIKNFKSDMLNVENQAKIFSEDYEKARKDLDSYIREYNTKTDELTRLNDEIGAYSRDISKLKEDEISYNNKITELNVEKRSKQTEISSAEQNKQLLIIEQEGYKIKDVKVQKLQEYYSEAEYLKKKIERYCEKKENEKRISLENAINDIFKDFYDEKIHFEVDSNYGVQIKIFDSELSEDFTSGGQDVAVALAFIGAIIKLNKEKLTIDAGDDSITEEDSKEMYPLIMDAPTSNFGMKQMNSFSQIIPKITDQIIVFINDKDGPILKQQMLDQIGREWRITKQDTYHASIQEVKING